MDEHKQAQWRANAPKKIVVSKLIIRSEKGNILLVKPTYKPGWQFPGGRVETDESPSSAVLREVTEELGLELSEDKVRVAGITYQPKDDAVIIIYELQTTVSEEAPITVQEEELETYKFVAPNEVPALVSSYYLTFWANYAL